MIKTVTVAGVDYIITEEEKRWVIRHDSEKFESEFIVKKSDAQTLEEVFEVMGWKSNG